MSVGCTSRVLGSWVGPCVAVALLCPLRADGQAMCASDCIDDCPAGQSCIFGGGDPCACLPDVPTCPADLNGDSTVNAGDLATVLGAWGPCPDMPGDCCAANATPGCDDAGCQSAVCALDPFCCDLAWDELCAQRAQEVCAEVCGGSGGCGVVAGDVCADVQEVLGLVDCEGAQGFGIGTAFSCDEDTCLTLAHDRGEAKCPDGCPYDCDIGVCLGVPSFCTLPQSTPISTPACPDGTGYVCTGVCVCDCGCFI